MTHQSPLREINTKDNTKRKPQIEQKTKKLLKIAQNKNLMETRLIFRALHGFRVELLKHGLSVKTVGNIIDSSFRALYRDARAQIEELKGRDPFIDIQWPRTQREKPDPFTAEERDKIIHYWAKNDFFYFPWVFYLVPYRHAAV